MLNINNEKNDKENENICNGELLYPLCYFLYENYSEVNNNYNQILKNKRN